MLLKVFTVQSREGAKILSQEGRGLSCGRGRMLQSDLQGETWQRGNEGITMDTG